MENPFFVNLHYAFQTDYRVLFIMNFVRGGDLFMHMKQVYIFSEEETKFMAAQLVLALGYLHSNGIVYRDLKLENILLNADGKKPWRLKEYRLCFDG
jgi:serine/threonine protein kinase